MSNEKNDVRVNIRVSEDLKNWFTTQAKEYGVSVSGLMTIALAQFKTQSDSLAAMSDINQVLQEIKKLRGDLKNNG